MRSAVFHDYFSTIGGGEKVALALAQCLSADIYSTEFTIANSFNEKEISVHSVGKIISLPFFKQISASWRFSRLNLSQKYDAFVFSGSWALRASKKHHPNIWYCHTPVRVFYDLSESFEQTLPVLLRPLFRIWAHYGRKADQRAVARVDAIVTNSHNTAKRIQRYYGREAMVIYPPIDLHRFSYHGSGPFWLAVNRLYPEKRIDLQIEAFRILPEESLIIVGGKGTGDHAASYGSSIEQDLPGNVKILGSVSNDELIHLYSTCRGLICTAMDEDFGITPLEAMASGKPVIAVNEGGFRETVIDGETGLLIEPTVSAIVEGIKIINKDPVRYREACVRQAGTFGGMDRFCREIRGVIGSLESHVI